MALPGYVFFKGKWRVPELLTELLGRFFLAFGDLPAVDHDIIFVGAPINLYGAEREIEKLHRRLLGKCDQALFFEVMAENADQRCSTFLPPQCGHAIFSFSCRAMVKVFKKAFLQSRQKNS